MTVSIANMAQVWMTNTTPFSAISMNVSTIGAGSNSGSRLIQLGIDGNTKFSVDGNGRLYAPGTVVQVVQSIKKDTWASAGTGGTTFYDVTGLTASITPTKSNSKILVNVSVHVSSGYWEIQGRLTRGGVGITDSYGNARGSRTQCSFVYHRYEAATTGYGWQVINYMYLDSPASTSSQTYGIQLNPYGGNYVAVNYNVYTDPDNSDYFGCPSSTITLMEIAQ